MQKKATVLFEIRLDEVESDSDSQQAYDEIYTESDISQTDSFYLWLLDILAFRPGEQYLDISCGRAQLPRLAQGLGVKAHGLDLSYAALRSGSQPPSPMLVTANSQDLPYANGRFDVVSNIGSLEHYVDMETAVAEMTRVLKPGGRAVVLVPNSFSLLQNIWSAYRKGRTMLDEQPIQRYASRYEWQDLLQSHGLIVTKTLKYDLERPRTRHDWQAYLHRPKKLARLAAAQLVPLNLAFCFVFLCHKPTHTE